MTVDIPKAGIRQRSAPVRPAGRCIPGGTGAQRPAFPVRYVFNCQSSVGKKHVYRNVFRCLERNNKCSVFLCRSPLENKNVVTTDAFIQENNTVPAGELLCRYRRINICRKIIFGERNRVVFAVFLRDQQIRSPVDKIIRHSVHLCFKIADPFRTLIVG